MRRIGKFDFDMKQPSRRFPEQEVAVMVVHELANAKRISRGTAAAYITPEGLMYVGVSIAAGNENFSRTTGRHKALGKAAQNLLKASRKPYDLIDVQQEDIRKRVIAKLRSAIEHKKALISYRLSNGKGMSA